MSQVSLITTWLTKWERKRRGERIVACFSPLCYWYYPYVLCMRRPGHLLQLGLHPPGPLWGNTLLIRWWSQLTLIPSPSPFLSLSPCGRVSCEGLKSRWFIAPCFLIKEANFKRPKIRVEDIKLNESSSPPSWREAKGHTWYHSLSLRQYGILFTLIDYLGRKSQGIDAHYKVIGWTSDYNADPDMIDLSFLLREGEKERWIILSYSFLSIES